jgi:enoyl-CoA hydratase
MMSEIELERDGAVAIVTLKRPHAMNALSISLRASIARTFRSLADDPDIRAIILTGAGDRAFCAGLDLRELGADASVLDANSAASLEANPVRVLEACSKPIIGAINGAAITGGFELALACDILIASQNARFADTHGRVGVTKEISLSGNFVGAEQALAWGFVNHVVPPEDLMGRAIALAQDIAQVPSEFVQAYKRLMNDGYALPLRDAIRLEWDRSVAYNADVDPAAIEARRLEVQRRGRSQ